MSLAALDFWRNSGWHLLDRQEDGYLVAGEDFMAAYFQRPELALVEESCDAEKKLHEKLIHQPFAQIEESEITAMADPDIQDNYRAVLAYRDFLASYPNLQSAYLAIAQGVSISFPPLFVDQMCHIILREVLKDEIEPIYLRAAEILFRSQSVTAYDGRIMCADHLVVEMQAEQQRLNMASGQHRAETADDVHIDVLTRDNQDAYWDRSEQFDTAIDLAFTQPGNDALARVLEKWVNHFLHLKVSVTPMLKIEDEQWTWHVGLDSVSSGLLDSLYKGEALTDEELSQILCLFKCEAQGGFTDEMKGKPVYLALSMRPLAHNAAQHQGINQMGVIQAKPQNLLANLPLKQA